MVSGAKYIMRENMLNTLRRIIRSYKRDERGFSLIELSIVLIIIGLLATPLIQEYGRYVTQKRRDDTAMSMRSIDTAIAAYQEMHGRYVCPSDRSIAFGEDGHGVENCANFAGLGADSCGGEGGGPGFCRATQAPGEVYIGGIPYVTLGLPFKETLDGWSNGITYAVTAAMATATPATFDPAVGAVRVTNELTPPTIDNFHGVLISAGDNGAGAFNIQGRQNPCITTFAEGENCDNDGTFMTSLRTEGAGTGYYDDIIRPRRWDNVSIWAYELGSDSNIYSVNSGNVGIGVPSPEMRLDIAGNLRTEQLHSSRYCNVEGTDCFDADFIGGDGYNCPDGQVAIGIAHETLICRTGNLAPNFATFTPCAEGTFIAAITNTEFVCRAP